MITVAVIRNGARYLTRHLRKNDYWSEGENEVQGEWFGRGAQILGLNGAVTPEPFEALRTNRHPQTGERLTAADSDKRVAFFDIQISAPKDVSVLALVGNDERVRPAFFEAAKIALTELETFAAVRERRGTARESEAVRLTRNATAALFLHDASRDLDPQLHVHAVFANATWDAERNAWFALQPAEMMRASRYVRQVFYRELAGRLRALGYDPYELQAKGFSVRGLEHLRTRFSKRARHVEALAREFAASKGRQPTKREIEILVKESRGDKLTEVSTPEVRARQRSELSDEECQALDQTVEAARATPARARVSYGAARNVLESAMRHVFERASVAREGEVLAGALELHPEFDQWSELRRELEKHGDVVRSHGEMTLRTIAREEARAVQRASLGRNTRKPLGDPAVLVATLTPGQRHAATALLTNRDFISVLVGDAGTGKTTALSALEAAHREAGGDRFIPLAPTTRARDALGSAGFDGVETLQRFLVNETQQRAAAGRVLLVDEAGLLSTEQMDRLTAIAESHHARVLLVGDTKQHTGVQRGDALRNLVHAAELPVVRLTEVLRQRSQLDRRFSRLLARGEVFDALLYADRQGMLREAGDDDALFRNAASDYVRNVASGIETLVVIPFWDEIDRFNEQARAALREHGLLGAVEVMRDSIKLLGWTEEQKAHWHQYRPGDRLLFVRNTRWLKQGASAEVTAVLSDGLHVRDRAGRTTKITGKQRGTYDVGRLERRGVSSQDRILIQGGSEAAGFRNGDLKTVESVDAQVGEVRFTDGTRLPADFHAWTYGHAVTSYRSQGSTAEESIMVLGEVAERSLHRRQFYVGNTRFRGAHRIHVTHKDAILQRLLVPDAGRELATEFLQRHQISRSEWIGQRHLRVASQYVRAVWQAITNKMHRRRHAARQRVEI